MSEEALVVRVDNLKENLNEKIRDIKKELGEKVDLKVYILLDQRVTSIEATMKKVAWILITPIIAGITVLITNSNAL